MTKTELKNDLLIRVAQGEAVSRPPVWLMRQAGRFLTEYKAVRERAGSFRNMIANPDYAIEVTLQPVDLVGVDAAIIFSDILVLPEAIGLTYEMIPGSGPLFPETIRSASDIDKLHPIEPGSNLDHTYEAIKGVIRELDGRVPLMVLQGLHGRFSVICWKGRDQKLFQGPKHFFTGNQAFPTSFWTKLQRLRLHI